MEFPLTRLREVEGVLQTDLTSSIQSPRKERARWLGKFIKLYLGATGLVILALGSFIIYQGFGGKAVQEISRRFLQFLPKGSTPQDGLIISEPKNLPKGELVTNRTNLPKPEEKKDKPSVLPGEGKSPSANIPAEVAPFPEPESLAASTQPSQIKIKKGESLARIIAQHYPKNEQIGLVAIILGNPKISKDDSIYVGQVLKLPKVSETDKIIQLDDNLYYIIYGRYYSDVDLKRDSLWLNKKNIRFMVRNTYDSEGNNVHRVILGGYETKDELEKITQIIKNKSK
jgi:hypothetical protein